MGKGRESFSAYTLAEEVCRSAEKDSRPSSVGPCCMTRFTRLRVRARIAEGNASILKSVPCRSHSAVTVEALAETAFPAIWKNDTRCIGV